MNRNFVTLKSLVETRIRSKIQVEVVHFVVSLTWVDKLAKESIVSTVAFGVTMTITKMMTTVVIAIAMVLALLPRSNLAFSFTQQQSRSPIIRSKTTTTEITSITCRKVALSAKDTIFSLNDDDDSDSDDTAEEIDAVHSDDIAEIVGSMMADENTKSSIDVAAIASALEKENENKKEIGDPLREDNGVRPSIHPIAINAIAEALKARAAQSISRKKQQPDDDDDDDEMTHFRTSDTVDPLMVMVTAGQFASDAIQKRQESSQEDGMLLNQGEEQTLAGRIMGVIMRLDNLEAELAERTGDVSWVAQYNEWESFGVLEGEKDTIDNGEDDRLEKVHAKILDDPLFCMNRAECLLAIFLQEVEIPQLTKLNETVPDESKIDFLDEDRQEVVLGSESKTE